MNRSHHPLLLALTSALVAAVSACHPVKPAATPTARPEPPPQESLLDFVPARARAAIIVRKNAIGLVHGMIDSDPELQRELTEHLVTTLGVDVSRFDGLVAFTTLIGPDGPKSIALVLRVDAPPGPLKLPQAASSDGVPYYRLGKDAYIARLKRGVVVGSQEEVLTSIALDAGREKAVAAESPFGRLLGADAAHTNLIVATAPGAVPPLQQVGVDAASLTVGYDNSFTLTARGERDRLLTLQALINGYLAKAVIDLDAERAKAKAGHDAIAGALAIIGYHQALRFQREAEAKVNGDLLSMSYRFPDDGGSTVVATTAIIGVLSAIAIPAFMKYIRRSKTTEAMINTRKLYDSAIAYYETEHADLTGRILPRSFPPSTDWTPPESPCTYPDGKYPVRGDLWNNPTWYVLNFSVDDPGYYSYKFESSGTGKDARFTVKARGDLNCDGVYSLFQRSATVNQDYVVTSKDGLVTDNELE